MLLLPTHLLIRLFFIGAFVLECEAYAARLEGLCAAEKSQWKEALTGNHF